MLTKTETIDIDVEINCANCGKNIPQYMPYPLDNGMIGRAPRKWNYKTEGYTVCEYCWLRGCLIPVNQRAN